MDWIFIFQTVVIGLYIKLIYDVNKSGVGNLKRGEIYKNKVLTFLYIGVIVLTMILGFLGVIFVFTILPEVFDIIGNTHFIGIPNDWKDFTFLILIISSLGYAVIRYNLNKIKKQKIYIEAIRSVVRAVSENIIDEAMERDENGYLSIEDLRYIIESEKKKEASYIVSLLKRIESDD